MANACARESLSAMVAPAGEGRRRSIGAGALPCRRPRRLQHDVGGAAADFHALAAFEGADGVAGLLADDAVGAADAIAEAIEQTLQFAHAGAAEALRFAHGLGGDAGAGADAVEQSGGGEAVGGEVL